MDEVTKKHLFKEETDSDDSSVASDESDCSYQGSATYTHDGKDITSDTFRNVMLGLNRHKTYDGEEAQHGRVVQKPQYARDSVHEKKTVREPHETATNGGRSPK